MLSTDKFFHLETILSKSEVLLKWGAGDRAGGTREGKMEKIENEVTDTARVQVGFCLHFSFSRPPFIVLVSNILIANIWKECPTVINLFEFFIRNSSILMYISQSRSKDVGISL